MNSLPRIVPTLLLLASAVPAVAQEITWRQDYGKAVAEAAQKGRPLFIDVGSDNCYWCRQLEQRTFTDDEIRKLLDERFIPLKINGTRNPYLVQSLRVQSYPTLVFASPDGTIVGYKEGFQDAATLKQLLQKVLANVAASDWMTRDYEAAVKANEANDPARALTLLRSVVEDGKDRPIQGKARQLIADIEKKAAAETKAADDLATKGKSTEAIAAYERVGKEFAGTLAARQSREALAKLANRSESGTDARKGQADDLLEQAQKDYKDGRYLICLDRCELLADGFADTTQAREAAKLVEQIKENPEWTRRASDQLSERLGVLYLSLAESWLRKGQPQQAVYYLERVVIQSPGSRLAEQAQSKLSRLRGTPEPKK